MKHAKGFLASIVTVCLFACTSPSDSQVRQQARKTTSQLMVRYGTSSEDAYTAVTLDGKNLQYTYNVRNSLTDKDPGFARAQQPHYTKDDLVTEKAVLTDAEVAQFARLIRRTKFLHLNPQYPARYNRRAYPEGITVTLDGASRSVRVLTPPAPDAYQKVYERLVTLVNSKMQRKLPTGRFQPHPSRKQQHGSR
jgi:hypothetical protein